MKATLIEIDGAVPPAYWYARYAGKRLWCTQARVAWGGECWLAVPGQGIPEHPDSLIFSEHAWQVREGEVELVLLEIEPVGRKRDLGSRHE